MPEKSVNCPAISSVPRPSANTYATAGGAGPPHGLSSMACAQKLADTGAMSSAGIGVSSQNMRGAAWIIRSWSS
jgi:hypothetical protein